MNPRIGSLCSGVEGLGLGVCEAFGWDPWQAIVWHADTDPAVSKVLAHRFPGVPNLGDIAGLDWTTVPPVDVLIGGTPCQDLSHAGKRGGMRAGTRSNLWVSMREAVAVLRPSTVIWENVQGALSADADSDMESCPGCVGNGADGAVLRALGRVVGDFCTLGYDCRWATVPASTVGACHQRERVFVVAVPTNLGRERHGATWPGGGDLRTVIADLVGDTASQRQSARACFGLLPREEPDPGCDGAVAVASRVGRGAWRSEPAGVIGGTGVAERSVATIDANTPIDWGVYRPAVERWATVLGRPAPEPTTTGARGGRQLSGWLTEWMMGFPDGWITDVPGISNRDAIRLCGNSVVPQQAAYALRLLLGATSPVILTG